MSGLRHRNKKRHICLFGADPRTNGHRLMRFGKEVSREGGVKTFLLCKDLFLSNAFLEN